MKMKIVQIFLLSLIFYSCSSDCKFESITTESLPDAIIGQEYSAKIEYDITCTYTSRLAEHVDGKEKLPPGIEMQGTGTFSGVPTEVGEYTFTINLRICFGTGTSSATDCTDKTKKYTINVVEE